MSDNVMYEIAKHFWEHRGDKGGYGLNYHKVAEILGLDEQQVIGVLSTLKGKKRILNKERAPKGSKAELYFLRPGVTFGDIESLRTYTCDQILNKEYGPSITS